MMRQFCLLVWLVLLAYLGSTHLHAQQPDLDEPKAIAQLVWPPLDPTWQDSATRKLAARKLPADVPTVRVAISGKVVDVGRRPIPDAAVLAFVVSDPSESGREKPTAELVAFATSNSSGDYSLATPIEKPARGTPLHLMAIAKDYSFVLNALMDLSPAQPMNVTLAPGTHVDLQAMTVDSSPLGGATLQLDGLTCVSRCARYHFPIMATGLPFEAKLASGSSGRMRIGNVPSKGSVQVRVSHADYPEFSCQILAQLGNQKVSTLSPQLRETWRRHRITSPVAIQFPPVDRGYLQVVDDQTGTPIVDAELQPTQFPLTPMRTDESGKCFFLSVPSTQDAAKANHQWITVNPPTMDHPTLSMFVKVDPNKASVVRLPRGVTLEGIVSSRRSDEPAQDAVVVWLADPQDPNCHSVAARVNHQGQFKIVVPRGVGTLVAHHDDGSGADVFGFVRGRGAATFPIQIDTAAMNVKTPLKLQASMPFERSIIVEDKNGNPVPGVRIRVVGSGLVKTRRTLTTDARGTAAITVKDEKAEFTLIAIKGKQGARVSNRDSPPSGSIRMALTPMATVTGRVLVEGLPKSGLTVELKPHRHSQVTDPFAGVSERFFGGKTDAQGMYRIPVAVDQQETFVIQCVTNGTSSKRFASVVVTPGADCDAADSELFVVRGQRGINGAIVDAKGDPVKTRIWVSRDRPQQAAPFGRLQCGSFASDDKGHFKLTGLPSNTSLFLLIRDARFTKVVSVDATQEFLEIKLP